MYYCPDAWYTCWCTFPYNTNRRCADYTPTALSSIEE